ncbi:hypothetical protein H6786_00455 [Candidatus Nomurabacteria bacterium]|nr:hypothetical protein [Candidatus Nomurabacteria bacterium]
MYKNLYDKHKIRGAFITEDNKKLIVNFEFSNKVVSFNKGQLIETTETLERAEVKTVLEKDKYFVCVVSTPEADLDFLYKISLAIAYVVGQNFELQYYFKEFPYYPTSHHWNIDSCNPISRRLFEDLLRSPSNTIRFLLSLLRDDATAFSQLVPTMLVVNAYNHSEVSFITEFGLLQKLSKRHDADSKLFTAENDLDKLSQFSNTILETLQLDYTDINIPALEKKLSTESLNSKTATNEKIVSYLNSFDKERIKSCAEYVPQWNKLRSSALVTHGGRPINVKDADKRGKMHKLHELLLDIVSLEVNAKYGDAGILD